MTQEIPALQADAPVLADVLRRLRWVIERDTEGHSACASFEHAGSGTIEARASDGDLEVSIKMPGTVESYILAPVHHWAKLLASQKGAVAVHRKGEKLTATTSSGLRFHTRVLARDEWPAVVVDGKPVAGIDVDAEQFGWAIQKTMTAMSADADRAYLNGVHLGWDKRGKFEGIRLVATDGRRLVRCQLPEAGPLDKLTGKGFDCILPAKAVRVIEKLLLETPDEARLTVTFARSKAGAWVTLASAEWRLTTTLMAGVFPDHQKAMPALKDVKHRVKIDAMAAEEALDQLTAIGKRQPGVPLAVQLAASESKVEFASNAVDEHGNPVEGMTSIEAEVIGPPVKVGFALTYLIDALRDVEYAAMLCVVDPTQPVYVEDVDEGDCLQVVMPAPLKAAVPEEKPAKRKLRKVKPITGKDEHRPAA